MSAAETEVLCTTLKTRLQSVTETKKRAQTAKLKVDINLLLCEPSSSITFVCNILYRLDNPSERDRNLPEQQRN